jgi:hypothetical protein
MITIKEELVYGPKLRRAIKVGGHEAVTLWLGLKEYAATHPTDGFVPTDAIENAAERLGIGKKLDRALAGLKECGELGPDGTRGAGLVDDHEHGAMLHDYGDHAMSADEQVERKLRQAERKQVQRYRAKCFAILVMERGWSSEDADQELRGLSLPELKARHRDMSQDVPRDTGDISEDPEGGVPPVSPAPAPAPVSAPARAPSPPQPDPPPKVVVVAREEARGPGFIACPPDLALTEAEFLELANGTGMTKEFVQRAMPQLRASFLSSNRRTGEQWQRSLVSALARTWSDVPRRNEILGVTPIRPHQRRPPVVQPSYGSTEETMQDFGFSEEQAREHA